MSNRPKPVGRVTFAPKPEAPQQEAVSSEQDNEGFATFAEVVADAKPAGRTSEIRSFTIKSKSRKFEIYTDGAEDAEVWSGLLADMQHGYLMQISARSSGQAFTGISLRLPVGDGLKEFTVTDPAYIGSVKVLARVLKRPAWTFEECLMMGHELGAGFVQVCDWAARANGVTEHFNAQIRELEKNAPTLSRPDTTP